MVGLVACNIGGSDEEKLKKVKVAEVTRSVFYAPLYVAIEQGLFKEEGLDVKVTTVWGGDKTMTALISDGADVALVGSETSIYVSAQGSTDPIINFAQLTQTDGTFLVSRKAIENFNWDLLKNSDFLGQRKGGMPQMVGEYVLKQHGIHPQNDLNLIQNIDFANIANAYISGTGDYVQLFEPQASMFEKEGRGYIVASFGTESGHVPYTTFMTKESYLTENEETVEKFTTAIYKAQQWVYENNSVETAKLIENYFEDTDLEIIESSIERYKSQESFAKNPILDEEEWENLQNIMDEAGELPKRVDYNTLVNTEFAEKVMK
ncbi:MAG: ABC transporter substrate-binding protein [Bacillus sp. (in: firmicutes)]